MDTYNATCTAAIWYLYILLKSHPQVSMGLLYEYYLHYDYHSHHSFLWRLCLVDATPTNNVC